MEATEVAHLSRLKEVLQEHQPV